MRVWRTLLGSAWLGLVMAGLVVTCGVVEAQAKRAPYRVVVTGAPYMAKTVTTSTVRLTNGGTADRELVEWTARNSDGWQWYKHDGKVNGARVTYYFVWNPVDHTRMSWCSCAKILYRRQFGDAAKEMPFPVPTEGEVEPTKFRSVALDAKVISGVTTVGLESTRMVKFGDEGQTKEGKLTVKTWYAPELHLVMLRLTDDPARGKIRYAVSDLKRGEPDAKLFKVPENWKVVESADSEEEQFE